MKHTTKQMGYYNNKFHQKHLMIERWLENEEILIFLHELETNLKINRKLSELVECAMD